MKIIVGIVLLLLVSAVNADTIELNNGKTFVGTFTGRDGGSIKFNVDGITMTFKATDVKNISMGGGAPASGTKNNAATAGGGSTARTTSIPAGTRLVIRLNQTLNPKKHKQGYKFTAKLESALVINGKTIIPAGTDVYGVVLQAKTSRRLSGKSSIKIGVTDIKVNGVMIPIRTTDLASVSAESAGKTGSQVVGAAAIGGLVDGSSGAKTGAKVGLGLALLSGGTQTEIPAGSLLEFGLTTPINIQ